MLDVALVDDGLGGIPLSALHQRLGFSPASFAKDVVIAALELANMWMHDTDLAAIQASIITSVLSRARDS